MFIVNTVLATLFLALNLARLCHPLVTHIARREPHSPTPRVTHEMSYLSRLIIRTPPSPAMMVHQLEPDNPTLLSRWRAVV